MRVRRMSFEIPTFIVNAIEQRNVYEKEKKQQFIWFPSICTWKNVFPIWKRPNMSSNFSSLNAN